jgi:hypothetical protein
VAINHRNRYGTTSFHEAVMSFRRPGEEELRTSLVEWLVAHGANPDSSSSSISFPFTQTCLRRSPTASVPDGDGCTARTTGCRFQSFSKIISDHDLQQITENSCAFCRRGGVAGKGKSKDGSVSKEEGELRATLRCGRCRARNCASLRVVNFFESRLSSADALVHSLLRDLSAAGLAIP